MPQHNTPYFLTVDAETEVISEGVEVISNIREEIEAEVGVKIPIVWFVRFQRGFDETVKTEDVNYFMDPDTRFFDAFKLAKSQLQVLQHRGDEIGWHYHAYNYAYRSELEHAHRVRILNADLASCADAIKTRHPCFEISSFRFGWFFVPDYAVFQVLQNCGIRADASVDPQKRGSIPGLKTIYSEPIVKEMQKVADIWFFPRNKQTILLHDWNLVPHEFDWRNQDKQEAKKAQDEFRQLLVKNVANSKKYGKHFSTYKDYVRNL